MALYDICVVGGCGHVGLPLAIAFAQEGKRVSIYDTNEAAVRQVSAGIMPFREEGADAALETVTSAGLLSATVDPNVVSESDSVVLIIGTPVDEFLNPQMKTITRTVEKLSGQFRDGQLLILRSTVYPGTSSYIGRFLKDKGLAVDVAFCPERIAEGHALTELRTLPQIISSFSPSGVTKARSLFGVLTDNLIELEPLEAELAKLFNNAWRYIKFATANQFFMIANDYALDFSRIHLAMTQDYPRGVDFPHPGFAAGPCLFKDTMQLAAFNNNQFNLGHAAMLINEGLPNYVVKSLRAQYNLRTMTIGILGMAFKGDSDDKRDSLSYKLKKVLSMEAKAVLCTDPFVTDDTLLPLETVLESCDLLILGAPHTEYRWLSVPGKRIVDVWNFFGGGTRA